MHEEHRVNHVDQIKIQHEHEMEISEILDEDNWGEHLSEMLIQIINDPQWIVNDSGDEVFTDQQSRINGQELLNLYRSLRSDDPPQNLNDIMGDSRAIEAITIRVMEVFAEKFAFTHVYRGGSLSNIKGGLIGTFTFDLDEAKTFIKRGRGGERKDPCLFALPVTAIVDFYKQNKGNVGFWAEHGLDEVFDTSFDIFMQDHVPEDLTVYVLEGEDPEDGEEIEKIDREKRMKEVSEKPKGLRREMSGMRRVRKLN
jgi:hypothetical protein